MPFRFVKDVRENLIGKLQKDTNPAICSVASSSGSSQMGKGRWGLEHTPYCLVRNLASTCGEDERQTGGMPSRGATHRGCLLTQQEPTHFPQRVGVLGLTWRKHLLSPSCPTLIPVSWHRPPSTFLLTPCNHKRAFPTRSSPLASRTGQNSPNFIFNLSWVPRAVNRVLSTEVQSSQSQTGW